jgi:methyl-accepting chemotaxis protein
LSCHGNPNASPWRNGKDVLGFEMENWKDGTLHGVFAISSDMSLVKTEKAKSRLISNDHQMGIFIGIGAMVSLFLAGIFLVKPLRNVFESTERLSDGASEVGNAIGVILGISHELSNASNQQAEAVQETAASMEEISSMVKKSASNAADSQKASEASRQRAIRGREVMAQMMTSMTDINKNNDQVIDTVQASNQSITEIVTMIREIGERTQVINDIVFQTKLLSFNASVEAARAGEHGKGFSVVAEEVGKLAQMSGEAAKDISDMLERSIKRVELIVDDTKTKVETIISSAKSTVDQGVAVATECRQVLSEIVESCDEVSQMVASIAVASKEQSNGVTEVSKAIHQIDQATQTSAGAANQCSSTSNELASQVKRLREVAADLRWVVEGKITMSRFVWGEQYRLHVPAMDDEHAVLIEKINHVARCLEAGVDVSGSAEFQKAFQSLAEYTQEHFSNEEVYMASIRYMGLERHKAAHQALLNKVQEFGAQAASGRMDGRELMEFLNDWLMRHILGVDMKYAKYSKTVQQSRVTSG